MTPARTFREWKAATLNAMSLRDSKAEALNAMAFGDSRAAALNAAPMAQIPQLACLLAPWAVLTLIQSHEASLLRDADVAAQYLGTRSPRARA